MAAITVSTLKQAVGGPSVTRARLVATLMRNATLPAYIVDGDEVTLPVPIKVALPSSGGPTTVDFGAGTQPDETFWQLKVFAPGHGGEIVFVLNFVFDADLTYDVEDLTEVDPSTFSPLALAESAFTGFTKITVLHQSEYDAMTPPRHPSTLFITTAG